MSLETVEQKVGAITGLQTFVTLGMIANTVDSFSGKEKVRDYFEKIEQRAKLDNWDEQTTIKIIKYRLTGEACKYFKTDKNLDSDTISYDDFKNKFIKKFTPVSIPGENMLKLGRTFQRHDETVSQFVTRVKSIGNDILAEDLKRCKNGDESGLESKCNDLVLNQFKIGLKKDYMKTLGTVLMRIEELTIDKAEELAKQEELNELMLKNRQSTASVFSINPHSNCFKCGKPGHFARSCRSFQNHSKNFRDTYEGNKQNSQSQRNNNFKRHSNFTQQGSSTASANRSNQYVNQGKRSQNYQGNRYRNNTSSNVRQNSQPPLNANCPPFTPQTGGTY